MKKPNYGFELYKDLLVAVILTATCFFISILEDIEMSSTILQSVLLFFISFIGAFTVSYFLGYNHTKIMKFMKNTEEKFIKFINKFKRR